jgi:transcription termination factor Rho
LPSSPHASQRPQAQIPSRSGRDGEEIGVEGASTLRKQELMFSILKVQAENGQEIMGMGTIEGAARRIRLPALA